MDENPFSFKNFLATTGKDGPKSTWQFSDTGCADDSVAKPCEIVTNPDRSVEVDKKVTSAPMDGNPFLFGNFVTNPGLDCDFHISGIPADSSTFSEDQSYIVGSKCGTADKTEAGTKTDGGNGYKVEQTLIPENLPFFPEFVLPIGDMVGNDRPMSSSASDAEGRKIQGISEGGIICAHCGWAGFPDGEGRVREDLTARLEEKNKQISDLKKELKRRKKTDTIETEALKSAMKLVEDNLSQASERARKAESRVACLQSELLSLQAQVDRLNAENIMLRNSDVFLSSVRLKSSQASEQLASAANAAEASLKQLQTGVENLRTLSKVLWDIDKVAEVPSDQVPSCSRAENSNPS